MRSSWLLGGFLFVLITFSAATLLLGNAFGLRDSDYLDVELDYLVAHKSELCGAKVKTVGTVRFLFSIYMYEDFWISGKNGGAIPVVARFEGLAIPPENSTIQVWGTIEYCDLEGGFLYLRAQCIEPLITSELSFSIQATLVLATTGAAMTICRKKQQERNT